MGATIRAMWQYRGFYSLVFKDILMRQARGTLLGFWWVLIKPLMTAAGFIFAFGVVAPLKTPQVTPAR